MMEGWYGFRDAELLQGDADLVSIREMDGFREVVRRWQAAGRWDQGPMEMG